MSTTTSETPRSDRSRLQKLSGRIIGLMARMFASSVYAITQIHARIHSHVVLAADSVIGAL
jgi:hypothetical protein